VTGIGVAEFQDFFPIFAGRNQIVRGVVGLTALWALIISVLLIDQRFPSTLITHGTRTFRHHDRVL